MTCPACRTRKLSVTETTDLGDRTQRTRRCDCGARFYTVELLVAKRAAMADLVAVPRSVLELIEEAAGRARREAGGHLTDEKHERSLLAMTSVERQ